MEVEKKQNNGFHGYGFLVIPRGPRSIRKRGLLEETIKDSQICDFELLAAVARKLMLESEGESEGSASSVNKLLLESEGYASSVNKLLLEREGSTSSVNKLLLEREGSTSSVNKLLLEREGSASSINKLLLLLAREGSASSVNKLLLEREGSASSVNKLLLESEDSASSVYKLLLESEGSASSVNKLLLESEDSASSVNKLLMESEGSASSVKRSHSLKLIQANRISPSLNSDLPSKQSAARVFKIKPGLIIKAKYEGYCIKFRLSLSPTLVEFQEEVAKRLKLEAGSYRAVYGDEEKEFTCDEDLQACQNMGKTSIVVLLKPK